MGKTTKINALERYKENAKAFLQAEKDIHIYSDVVNNDLILPMKSLYTMRDFNMLCQLGFDKIGARFICICSAIYHNTKYSAKIESSWC